MILKNLIKIILLSTLILLISNCNLFNNKSEKSSEEHLKNSETVTGISHLEEKKFKNARVVIEAFTEEEIENQRVDTLISYSIEENDFEILSMLFSGYEYDFGGNVQGYIKSYNLSKLSLKSINFSDIFINGTDTYFEEIINNTIEKFTNISVAHTENNRTNELKFSEINFKIEDSVMYFKNDEVIFVYPQYKIIDDENRMPIFKFRKSEIENYLIKI